MFDEYLGIEFVDHSMDCWGLVRKIYAEKLKIELPTYGDGYENVGDEAGVSTMVMEGLAKHFTEVTEPERFDLVVIRINGLPRHLGMAVNNTHFIHCPEPVMGRGGYSAMERFADPLWHKRIVGFYRPCN